MSQLSQWCVFSAVPVASELAAERDIVTSTFTELVHLCVTELAAKCEAIQTIPSQYSSNGVDSCLSSTMTDIL